MTIFCYDGGSGLAPIRRVQNVSQDLGLSQTVARDGSEWARSVEDTDIVAQSFSEFYGESVVSTLSLTSTGVEDRVLLLSSTSAITFTQATTVAGGRLPSSGGGGGDGDTISTFDATYDSAGSAASEGQLIYIDDSDGEAKLATNDSTVDVAEVIGFLTEDVTAGDATTIQTEGEVNLSDWTAITGTANLTRGATYYLHTGGEMRSTAPSSGNSIIVGRAITATRFDIEIDSVWEL